MRWAIVATLLMVSPALAQQPDVATLQKAVQTLQQQRNQAWDAAATAQIEIQKLNEELQKAKGELEKLKKPTEPK